MIRTKAHTPVGNAAQSKRRNHKTKKGEPMELKSWLESIILSILLIFSIVAIALLVEVTKGLVILIILAVWLMAIAIKKSITKIKGETKND